MFIITHSIHLRLGLSMTLLQKSPTSGASPNINKLYSTFYLLGSLSFGLYILIINIYIPFLRIRNDRNLFNKTDTIILLFSHALLLGIVGWCYLRVRLTNPGNIPRPHKLTCDELHALESGDIHMDLIKGSKQLMANEIMACESTGAPKYCETCQIHRPMRTSHCQETGRCILKLDHYCPLLSSAIGVGNYKYYLHFLIYTALLAVYLQILGIIMVSNVDISPLSVVFLVLSSFFADCLLIPLTSLHIWMVFNNITTKEFTLHFALWQSAPKSIWVSMSTELGEIHGRVCLDVNLATKPWSQGFQENWTSVMGNRWWQWLLPMRASSDFDGCWREQRLSDSTQLDLLTRASCILVKASTGTLEMQVPEKVYLKYSDKA
jgi:hypothetical protein